MLLIIFAIIDIDLFRFSLLIFSPLFIARCCQMPYSADAMAFISIFASIAIFIAISACRQRCWPFSCHYFADAIAAFIFIFERHYFDATPLFH
jgi:hypothetical protein